MKDKAPLPLSKGQFKKIEPHLQMALLRRTFKPLVDKKPEIFGESEDPFFKLVAAACSPAENELEEHLMLLSDLAAGLLFNEEFPFLEKVEKLLARALPEVEEAYKAVKRAPGGWSYSGDKDKRKESVLKWFRENQGRLQVLEEKHLQDLSLYFDAGGQEKRHFQGGVLINIIESGCGCEIQVLDIHNYLKRARQGRKWLEKVMAGEAAP